MIGRFVTNTLLLTTVLIIGGEVFAQQSLLTDINNIRRNTDIGTGFDIQSTNAQIMSQYRAPVFVPVGSQNLTTASSLNRSRPTKPFTNAQPRSTVSPYLNLFTENLNDNSDNYSALVRPMLNQQRRNQQFQRAGQQLQRQNQALNARFQQLSAQPAYAIQGNANIFTTGHSTLFNNTSHYYPARR